jgi:tellurite resistance protein
MLAAGALLPYARPVSLALFAAGALFTILFAVWRTGGLWQGERQDAMTTPVLYLPAVAGSFVTATLLGALGFPDWGQYVFGAGLFTWFAIESVLVHRFYTVALPPPMRPTLGVQLAPAPVGAVAYLSVTSGAPDIVSHAMIGYGILQALILLRLLPWIRQEPFAPSYWAFTFGATALAAAPMRLIAHGDAGPALIFAPIFFVAANLVVVLIAIGTLRLLVTGRLPVGWQDLAPKKSDMVGQG